jgi:hypothetical protein
LKQLHEALGNTLEQIDIGNDFLIRIQKDQHLRETMKKWECVKLRSFCTARETITRLNSLPQNGRKIFANYSSDKDIISRNTGNSKKSAPKESMPR